MNVVRWPISTSSRVLCVDGPLRTPIDGALRHRVQRLVRAGERLILLDLSRVTRIDAAGIGELVRAYNLARAEAATLQVVNPTPWVEEIIQRVGLDEILIAETADVRVRC